MNNTCKKTSIGGQALIEGIMMRGPQKTCMAVRKPDGEIDLEAWDTPPKKWYSKIPLLRGVFNMVSSLADGYKCLMKSADKAGQEEEPSKFEKWLAEKCGADVSSLVSVVATVLGVGLALLLFMVIPSALSSLLKPLVASTTLLTVIEGVIKIIVFLIYLYLCTRLEDIRRVFQYHGAEHKTIACYEAGEELTPENIRKYSRFHPRCGTSFIFLVLIISILVFSLVTWDTLLKRLLLKLLLLPVVIGVSYELLKISGRSNSIITRIIAAPGLWLQRLTTVEPADDGVLEVAIAAMNEVIPENENDDKW